MKKILILIFLSLWPVRLLPLTSDICAINDCVSTSSTSASGFTSLYGDQAVFKRKSLVCMHFNYGIQTDAITVASMGSGSVSHDSSNSAANISTGSSDGESSVSMVSKKYLAPLPFCEESIFFTVSFDSADVSGTKQWVGLIDDSDGFALGVSEGVFSIFYRNGGIETTIAQSSFNIDGLDGSGGYGLNLDFSKFNTYRISFGWMGISPVVFEVLTPEGNWQAFHIIKNLNSIVSAVLGHSSLPVGAGVSKLSSSDNIAMKLIAVEAGVAGGREQECVRNFSTSCKEATTGETNYPVLTIKNKTTFNSKSNRIGIQISMLDLFNLGAVGCYSLVKNGTLVNASFADVDINSVAQKDIQATAISGGTTIFNTFVRKDDHKSILLDTKCFVVMLFPGETLTVVVDKVSAKSRKKDDDGDSDSDSGGSGDDDDDEAGDSCCSSYGSLRSSVAVSWCEQG